MIDAQLLTMNVALGLYCFQVLNRDMSMTKMKSTMFVGVILLGVFGLLNHLFEGSNGDSPPPLSSAIYAPARDADVVTAAFVCRVLWFQASSWRSYHSNHSGCCKA